MARHAKTYAIVLLGAASIGSAVIAWRQYGELVELRAAAMNRDERADLQKRVWDLEKANRELQSRLAPRGPADADELLASAGSEGRSGRDRPDGGRGDPRGRGGFDRQATVLRDLMNKPEVQAMVATQQRTAIEARYAALFRLLNLPADQAEKVMALLSERTTTMIDVLSAARDQGIDPRENPEAFRKLVSDAQNEIDKGIKAVIGEQGFAQLANYEETLPQRNIVNELQQRLSFTAAPLSSTQAEQLVQILAMNAPARPAAAASTVSDGGGRMSPPPGRGPDIGGLIGSLGGGDAGLRGGPTATVTSAAVAQAQSVLTAPQVAALQQIQQQQAAQQQLRTVVNDALNQSAPSSGSPARKKGG